MTLTGPLARVDASWGGLRVALEREALPPGWLEVEDGWAEAVTAGNAYEHYEEHLVELGVVLSGSSA